MIKEQVPIPQNLEIGEASDELGNRCKTNARQGDEVMFRMRRKIFPENDYEACEQKYQTFLGKNQKYIDDSFYEMFRYDYFHDGNFSEFHFDFHCRTLTMVLCCPNYLNLRDECVNIDYRIVFSNVSRFDYRLDGQGDSDRNAQVLLDPIFFLHGEIGTLLSPRKKMSLIMELCSPHANSPLWVSLIFDQVKISPVEPLAFEVLKRTDHLRLE